ncbi:hypothetical protein [Teredinibacter haidensis]|uniref:hypothetical protein n=1 Tax=Teredinibacter haidensis TaxID=2731755 RepID=UPI00163C97BB|nr:hypothetical protein [Teredinibacter haidensis]
MLVDGSRAERSSAAVLMWVMVLGLLDTRSFASALFASLGRASLPLMIGLGLHGLTGLHNLRE